MRFTPITFLTVAFLTTGITAHWGYTPPPPPPNANIGQPCPNATTVQNGGCGYNAVCAYNSTFMPTCYAAAGRGVACNSTVICGSGQICTNSTCTESPTLGANCHIAGLPINWCGGGMNCTTNALFPTIAVCLQVAYNGQPCDPLIVCASNSTAIGNCTSPNTYGVGTCSGGLNRTHGDSDGD